MPPRPRADPLAQLVDDVVDYPSGLLGAKRIDVTWYGKAGTFCLMFAFPLFLAGSDPDLVGADLFTIAAWGFGLPGLALSYYAAVLYVPIGLAALREGRASRHAGLIEEAS